MSEAYNPRPEKPRPRAFLLNQLNDEFVAQPDYYEAEAQEKAQAQAARAEAQEPPSERATEEAQREGFLQRKKGWSWGGVLLSALGALFSIGVGLWLEELVANLFAKSMALGWISAALVGLVLLALTVLVSREIAVLFRQQAIARLHRALAIAHETDDGSLAKAKIAELAALYADKPEAATALKRLKELKKEIIDGAARVEIAEKAMMPGLDAEARREIAKAARNVSMVTTLAPRAIIDVVFVAAQALRLIRRISEIYGGRPGMLGAFRLARAVTTHLALTGTIAIGDSLLQQIVGHGVASRISSKLGEGVLNGLLTARIGLSAMAVCRPMPFIVEKQPGVGDVAPFLFRRDKDKKTG
ncbi:putative membrane protein [Rhodoblastus acidophilus]|uniref:Putative membrane protein n=1 Tax=Rhodoblastus acidophilus TaxID=1074 RepID=A0A212RSW2_RHOAC|nr:TIGR01620 family protein [Rhodoblastus acidophilus]MCW2315454.1 putative membrane protein [Rhodoblastus acidophilus]PPQ40704.1 TIGR01620 family protein [Rhodoblastus acidophilus]RAI21918.1 TIGR01620 family protein [Rhodoblastus acidophilus]SNB75757.1 putative membrane protein [Rhodoblastus acidophilus]